MDLEHSQGWLKLAQQPYPVVREFLKHITSIDIEDEAHSLINPWLQKYHCKINHSKLKQSLSWLEQPGQQLIAFPQYPQQLKAIKDPPPVLFLSGHPKLLFLPQLAIVGSRKPSYGGRENALYFATCLARSGLTLISGLAIGIDGLVHRAALEAEGNTVAVLGCGHNTCYPYRHQALFQQIKEKGLLISEFTPDTPVRAAQFPRRNRIISGLSLGVLVVEAAIKSGSLITCRLAAEQGREVFAIPGDITNPMSGGGHHLIRQGACLVDSPEQILEELEWQHCLTGAQSMTAETCIKKNYLSSNLSTEENTLLQCINRHPTAIDLIVNRAEMKMSLVLSVLFSLELKGIVIGSADGFIKK